MAESSKLRNARVKLLQGHCVIEAFNTSWKGAVKRAAAERRADANHHDIFVVRTTALTPEEWEQTTRRNNNRAWTIASHAVAVCTPRRDIVDRASTAKAGARKAQKPRF